MNSCYYYFFVDEWKDFTEKLSKANTAKFEAQAKLSDIQSSMVTIEVNIEDNLIFL